MILFFGGSICMHLVRICFLHIMCYMQKYYITYSSRKSFYKENQGGRSVTVWKEILFEGLIDMSRSEGKINLKYYAPMMDTILVSVVGN